MPKQMPKPVDDLDTDFGLIIAMLRTGRKLEQRELEKLSGVSRSTISNYERGKSTPGLKTLNRLVLAMGYPLWAIEQTRLFIRRFGDSGNLADAPAGATLPPEPPLPVELEAVISEGSRACEAHLRNAIALSQEAFSRRPPVPAEPKEPAVEPPSPEALFQEVVQAPAGARRALVAAPRFQDWRFAVHLADQSLNVVRTKPAAAVEFAELGLQVAARLVGELAHLAKLHWYLLAHLGNAQRAVGELQKADPTFQRADQYGVIGTGFHSELLEEARPPALLASLRKDQNRLAESLKYLDVALSKDPSQTLRASILVNKATALSETEQIAKALATLDTAEGCIDAATTPQILFCARSTRLECLCHAERYAEARDLLPAAASLPHSALDRIRLVWVEGRIVAGLGNVDRGIQLLAHARAELASRHQDYDVAVVSLELAGLYAQKGNTMAVKALAGNLAPLFRASGVHREALAALAIFRQAAERAKVTTELTKKIVSYLYRARHNPELRFEVGPAPRS